MHVCLLTSLDGSPHAEDFEQEEMLIDGVGDGFVRLLVVYL